MHLHRSTPPASLVLVLVGAASGCLPNAPGAAEDAGTPPPRVTVVDALGRTQDARGCGRRPRFVLTGPAPAADAAANVLLVSGDPDDALLEDARRSPLTSASRARSLPIRVSTGDDAWQIVPASALAAGSRVSLVVPAFVLGHGRTEPLVTTLDVSPEDCGAILVESFPPDGTTGLSAGIRTVDLGFDDVVEDVASLTLRDDAGALVSIEATDTYCIDAGLAASHCVRIRIARDLEPDRSYRLDCSGLRDRHGDAPCERPIDLTTTTEPVPAVPIALTCAFDERATPVGCLLEQDDRVTMRMRLSGLARLSFAIGDAKVVTTSRAGDAELTIASLDPDEDHAATIVIEDAVGSLRTESIDVRTALASPAVVIGEFRADAIGPEPAQEYVELWNLGETAIDLGGFFLADAPEREGDVLPSPLFVPRHGVVLVVADSFDSTNPLDVSPPPGATLARIGASIAASGLTNAGEPLYLRDPTGHRVAASPAVASPRAGSCIARDPSVLVARAPAAYAPAPGGCTPGIR